MIKNSLISGISKQENKGSVKFQIVNFTNKIRRLTSYLEFHERYIESEFGIWIFFVSTIWSIMNNSL
ncbi:hypothetical protein K2173_011193 [Erythroxylum novogranatense]|uniref:Uncharacterized protein n=1 Tax=Erythroxylum novogranatense TaxID=1862640 RepID=A0AAV8U4U9_9ROSI|nr:hypothetical protein K2173_011193 [Erythroxylum novogranatense]